MPTQGIGATSVRTVAGKVLRRPQLRDMSDREYGGIAQSLAVPVGTVRSRIWRAHRELGRQSDLTKRT
jgi:hypothetical protein